MLQFSDNQSFLAPVAVRHSQSLAGDCSKTGVGISLPMNTTPTPDTSKATVQRIDSASKLRFLALATSCQTDRNTLNQIAAELSAMREVEHQLYMALPYVEEAERDPAYKPGHVAAVTKAIRQALAALTSVEALELRRVIEAKEVA